MKLPESADQGREGKFNMTGAFPRHVDPFPAPVTFAVQTVGSSVRIHTPLIYLLGPVTTMAHPYCISKIANMSLVREQSLGI